MKIDEIETHSVSDLASFIEHRHFYMPGTGHFFRGQTNATWKLIPKAGRPEFTGEIKRDYKPNESLPSHDLRQFERWRSMAIAYCDSLPSNDFECLAYAQHYGLATRLLDWSTNPLVALFFAVENDPCATGIVYCYHTSLQLTARKLTEPISAVCFFRPRPIDRRILAQQGVFTYHPDPQADFPIESLLSQTSSLTGVEAEPFLSLASLTIPGPAKNFIMEELAGIGITRQTLFPDLEGLSNFLNWESTAKATRLNQITSAMRGPASGPPLRRSPLVDRKIHPP